MARIRTIKPEFFTSEDIVSMSPLARLFYVSLWCEADRCGRLEWRPGTLKMRYFPGDACSIEALGEELKARGLIRFYSIDGKSFADIPTFNEHQVINNREADSTLPAFPVDACMTRESGVKAEGKEGREGKEGKGREGASVTREFPNIPTAFQKILKTRPELNGDHVYAKFAAHYDEPSQTLEKWKAWVARETPDAKAMMAITVPSRAGRDPVLEKLELDALNAAPMPADLRAKLGLKS
jgi:hypothetical protein